MNINKTAAWGWFWFLAVAALAAWVVLVFLVLTYYAIIGKPDPETMIPSNFGCSEKSCQVKTMGGDCAYFGYDMSRCQAIGTTGLSIASALSAFAIVALGFALA